MKLNLKKLTVALLALALAVPATACGNKAENTGNSGNVAAEQGAAQQGEMPATFPEFTGADLDGNKLDQTVFNEHAATVVNFWFTDCGACVQEMPTLQKLADGWKDQDVALKGLLVERDKNDKAKEILKTKGVNYQNIVPDEGDGIDGMITNIFAFPTTIVVDREGNIVGDPIQGSLDTQDKIKELQDRIDEVVAKDKENK